MTPLYSKQVFLGQIYRPSLIKSIAGSFTCIQGGSRERVGMFANLKIRHNPEGPYKDKKILVK